MCAAFVITQIIINEEGERNLRHEKKLLRDVSNPFTLNEEYFRQHCRLVYCKVHKLLYLAFSQIKCLRARALVCIHAHIHMNTRARASIYKHAVV